MCASWNQHGIKGSRPAADMDSARRPDQAYIFPIIPSEMCRPERDKYCDKSLLLGYTNKNCLLNEGKGKLLLSVIELNLVVLLGVNRVF